MKRLLLLILAIPIAASAQFQLYLAPPGGEEKAVSGVVDLGPVAVADAASLRFRIRNTGSTSANLTRLLVSGSGFSMTGAPSLPFIVAPGLNVDFTIRFSPPNFGSYSANLQVNSTGYILSGSGLPGAALRVNGTILETGAAIDFGRVERGSSSSVSVQLVNNTTEMVPVNSISITGSQFSFVNGAPAPLTLRPGEISSVELRFTAAAAAIATGSLTVDRRSFQLTGSGFEPAMPRPVVIIETPSVRSGEQGRISIRLESASRAAVKGQLRMELRPAGTMKDNDSAAQFITGGRTVPFDVAVGDTTVKLRGDSSVVFQAGTTAGTLVFIVEAGGFTEQASVAVAAEAVRIDKATAVRTASGIDVQLTGFDNTRSLADMSFTFFDKSGQPLPGMPVNVQAGADFDRWWNSSTMGGIFQLKASFPVSGDASKIGGVQVKVANSGWSTSTDRMTF